MRKNTVFTVGLLTATNVAARVAGMAFRLLLAARLSPEALGEYQLALTVLGFFSSLTASGLPPAVTRACAKQGEDPRRVLTSGLRLLAPVLGLAAAVLCFGRGFLAGHFLHGAQNSAVFPLLALALAAGSAEAVLDGFYHGQGRSVVPALAEIGEQAVKLLLVLLLSPLLRDARLPALVQGLSGCLALVILLVPVGRLPGGGREKELLADAIPPTAARLLGAAIHMITVTVLPLRLMAWGLSRDAAMAQYGILTGMAYPVVFLPMTAVGALTTVLMPSVAAGGNGRRKLRRALAAAEAIALPFAAFLFFFAPGLSQAVWHTPLAGRYMVLLIPSVIFLPPVQVMSAYLFGRGRQKTLFFLRLADGLTGLALTFFLAGRFGLTGFVLGNGLQDLLALAAFSAACRQKEDKKTD